LLVLDDLGCWAPQWDQLVDLSPLPSPFLRSWWLTGTGLPQRRFVLVVAGRRLLGGLALEERRRFGLPCLTMLSAGPLCPDHLDLLAEEGHEDAVVNGVAAWLQRPGMRLIDLEGIYPDSRLIKALPGRVRREPLAGAPWAPLRADASAYLAARPAGFRRTLQRASSRLAADGVTHRINRGTSAVLALDVLRQLHSAQWGDRSRFLPSFDRFAAGCRLGTESDEVAVHELTIGETVIAIIVTFEVAGRLSLYQSARLTERRWRNAPSVLLAAIITDACERGFAEVDFLRGDESYKTNFAPERRELLRLRAANGAVGRVALLAETAERKVRVPATRLVRFAGRRRAGALLPSGGPGGGPHR
jgi:CelD/BcsL family acetyltransferase involved in cellulose biosynthesis